MTKFLAEEIRNHMENVVASYITHGIPFRLHLINSDNWNNPLPDEVKDRNILTVDIINYSLEESYVTDDGIPYINLYFGEEGYNLGKFLNGFDILAISNPSDGSAIFVKPFDEKQFQEDKVLKPKPLSVNIEDKDQKRSIDVFRKNNPNMFKGK